MPLSGAVRLPLDLRLGRPPHIPLCCPRVPTAGEQAAVSSLATARPPGQDPAAGTVRQRRQRSRQSRRSEPAAGGACQRASRPALAAVHAVIIGDRICSFRLADSSLALRHAGGSRCGQPSSEPPAILVPGSSAAAQSAEGVDARRLARSFRPDRGHVWNSVAPRWAELLGWQRLWPLWLFAWRGRLPAQEVVQSRGSLRLSSTVR